MGNITRHVDIRATRSDVWAVLEDVRLLPQLSTSTVSVEASDRLDAVGQEFTQTVELAGRSFTSTWTVLELESQRRLVIEGSVLPGTRYRMTEVLSDHADDAASGVPDGHVRLCLTMDYRLPFGPLGRLAGRLGAERRAIDEASEVLDGVRRLVEQRTAGTDR